ncbi:MAG: biofilm regulation phosphoprotein SiaC [Pigmentiphaga sp.]
MNDLSIPGTPSTPDITGDIAAGILRMSGESYPENAYELFAPVFEWIEAFLAETGRPLRIELELLYLNTSSIKTVMDIFDLLESAHQRQRDVAVHWYFDQQNERIGELAEEFREDCTFPFHVIGK